MKRLVLCIALVGCGSTATVLQEADPPTTTTIEVVVGEPPVPPIALVATVSGVPERLSPVQVTDTLPPPVLTPEAMVNWLPYDYVEGKETALQAFRITAKALGWDSARIEAWIPFADDVMAKESGYCWNLLRGATVSSVGCVLKQQGTNDDAGIAQLTSVWHGRSGPICVQFGFCGRHGIIASPWTSFQSFVRLLEIEGSGPWCWSTWARSFHKCGLAPDR